MKQSTIIVVNSVASAVRTVFVIALGFVSTRLLLQCIGLVDYGVLTALGATGLATTVLVGGLGNAAQRHVTFEVGQRNDIGVVRLHSTSLVVFFVLSLLILGLGLLIKPLVFSILNAPAERIDSAKVVYVVMVIQWVLAALTTPYRALMHAHQHLLSVSVFGLAHKFMQLVVVLSLIYFDGDHLVIYVYLVLCVHLLSSIGLVLFVTSRYSNIRPNILNFNWSDARRLITFGFWSLASMLVFQLRQQGAILAINVYFGPVVNAAYAIAVFINGHLHQASGIVHTAVQPAITTAYAQSDYQHYNLMISSGSRFTYFSALFIFIPLFFEAPFFLDFWLGEYPSGTVEFIRLVTVSSMLGYLVNGHGMAMIARNQIRSLVIVSSGTQLLFLGLGIGTLGISDAQSWFLPASMIICFSLLSLCIPFVFGHALDFSISQWGREVLLPCLQVTCVGFIVGYFVYNFLDSGMIRLLGMIFLVGVALSMSITLFGMTPQERRLISKIFGRLFEL